MSAVESQINCPLRPLFWQLILNPPSTLLPCTPVKMIKQGSNKVFPIEGTQGLQEMPLNGLSSRWFGLTPMFPFRWYFFVGRSKYFEVNTTSVPKKKYHPFSVRVFGQTDGLTKNLKTQPEAPCSCAGMCFVPTSIPLKLWAWSSCF